MDTVPRDKSVLRRKFRDLRKNFSVRANRAAVDALAQNLTRFLADYPEAECALYRATPEEAPCDLEPTTEFFFPVIRGEELEFRKPRTRGAFQSHSRLNLSEPDPALSSARDPGRPFVVCCPAVAVDLGGGRLGLGKGYYDRYLAAHPLALRVGVAFEIQISATPLPADGWDQRLDWIVTESAILRTHPPQRSSPPWI